MLPYLFAGLFRISDVLFPGPRNYIGISRILLIMMSIPSVAAVYFMGLRRSFTHALIVGTVAATWFELVYFSFRPLTEAIATDFLILALALASVPEDEYTPKRLWIIGFCLSLCAMLRMHLAPGVVVAASLVCRFKFRGRWVPILGGAIFPLMIFGAADWITWGTPFGSYIAYVRINVIQGKASEFGAQPIYWYFQIMNETWAGVLPIIAGLVALGFRSAKLWASTGLAILVIHSLIPHKEYRFIFPAFACFVLAAAISSADLVEKAGYILGASRTSYLRIVAVASWFTISLCLAFAPGFFEYWYNRGEMVQLSFWLHDRPNLCGLLLYDVGWGETGGYAYLHRNIPIYQRVADEPVDDFPESTFNYMVLTQSSLVHLKPEFLLQRCEAEGDDEAICVAMREGSCTLSLAPPPMMERTRVGDPSFEPKPPAAP